MKAQHSRILVVVAALGSLFLFLCTASAQRWTLQTGVPKNCLGMACSADGTKLFAYGDGLYTSSDWGATWTLTSATATNWSRMACSADGTKLVAAVYEGGIYTSVDSGTNWTLTSAPATYWIDVASSADGTKLVAVVLYAGGIYTSEDSGATWTLTSAPDPNEWTCVASSADGSKLVAGAGQGIYYPGTSVFGIVRSSDFGASWNQTSAPGESWSAIGSSADGTKLIAAGGDLYTSSDSGTTWIQVTAPNTWWEAAASSADGVKLVAAAGGDVQGGNGYIYTSSDSGATWTQAEAPVLGWSWLASSADGTKLVATTTEGYTYTFDASSVKRGSLQVTIAPPGAVSAGAEWRVDTGTCQKSSATVTNLSTGAHTVSFRPISGWNTPSNQVITITNGITTTAAGIYEEMGNPKLTISAPKTGQKWSNYVFAITGTVSDVVAVSNVFFSLNGAAWTNATTANGWSNWTASAALTPGTNTVAAYAVDTSSIPVANHQQQRDIRSKQSVGAGDQSAGRWDGQRGRQRPMAGYQPGLHSHRQIERDGGFLFENWTQTTNGTDWVTSSVPLLTSPCRRTWPCRRTLWTCRSRQTASLHPSKTSTGAMRCSP